MVLRDFSFRQVVVGGSPVYGSEQQCNYNNNALYCHTKHYRMDKGSPFCWLPFVSGFCIIALIPFIFHITTSADVPITYIV